MNPTRTMEHRTHADADRLWAARSVSAAMRSGTVLVISTPSPHSGVLPSVQRERQRLAQAARLKSPWNIWRDIHPVRGVA